MVASQQLPAVPADSRNTVEPVPASLSGQASVNTILNPVAVLHAPMDTEQQAGPFTGLNLFRVACVCGYRGCWYRLESFAMDAHLRHAARNIGGQQ